MSASRIELAKLDGDLPGLQSAMGPLIPLVAPSPTTAENAPSIVQMLATNQLVCTSGKLSGSMLASFDGTTMTISKPLTITVANMTMQERSAGAGSECPEQRDSAIDRGGVGGGGYVGGS